MVMLAEQPCALKWCCEESKAQRQQSSAVAVGKESEVADAHEARWQQMEQEAAQELIDCPES